jgi:hypothetical protein
MQGIESLDNFKKFVSSLGGLGRYEDTYIVHAAEGETVVPMEVLDRNPALKKRLFQSMVDMGIEPGRYIVGNELNSRNPVTGQPEFFLKKIVSQIRKALPGDTEQFLGPIVGLATGSLPLGAIAGAIGSGVPGAIAGGLGGLRSPGLEFFTGPKGKIAEGFVAPLKFDELLKGKRLGEFFLGKDGEKGILGSTGKFFNFSGKPKEDTVDVYNRIKDDERYAGFTQEQIYNEAEKISEASKGVMAGMDLMEAAKFFGLGTLGLGTLIKLTDEQQDVGLERDMTQGNVLTNLLDAQPLFAEEGGGVTDLRQGGESVGPGTGTSDDIPAMLSDGEFVMTAKAVRGAGGGDRREGAKKMYKMMDQLEAQA